MSGPIPADVPVPIRSPVCPQAGTVEVIIDPLAITIQHRPIHLQYLVLDYIIGLIRPQHQILLKIPARQLTQPFLTYEIPTLSHVSDYLLNIATPDRVTSLG